MNSGHLAVFEKGYFRTNDPCEARSLLSDRYKSHQIRCADKDPFDFAHRTASVRNGSFNILRYGGSVEIIPEPFDDFFMLELPLIAGVDIVSNGRPSVRSDENTALFLPPHVRFSSTWRSGRVQLMLKISNSEVLRRWQYLTGDPEAQLPRVHPELELNSAGGWRVRQLMMLLQKEMELSIQSNTDQLSQSPISGAIIDAVLSYYRYREGNHRISGAYQILPGQLRHCVAFIERNLASDLSLSKLLSQTNYSKRTLFNQFNHFLGMTPKGYVQQQRLRNSRRLLLTGDVTVSDAARLSGFTHMGRFSSLYRKRYGENPSQT